MNINEEIKRRILEKFPFLFVSIFPDETQDNTIVAIDDDLYYSEDYLALIMDIKINILWKNDLFNYLFVKEKHQEKDLPNTFVSVVFPAGNRLNVTWESSPVFLSDSLRSITTQPHDNRYLYKGESLWPMAA
jgi:hypothetical protein